MNLNLATATSRDGTPIAYHRAGSGTPVIFVAGVFNDHTTCAELAALLEADHTVVNYDRRGRGSSGDTKPYAIDREVEDLIALIDVVGGSAAVFGYSSGAVLALLGAAEGAAITHLALYEPPFVVGDVATIRPTERPGRLAALVAQGRPGDAVATFQLEHIGLPPEMVEQIQSSPMWTDLTAMAPSMVYDAIITTTLAVPTAAMTAVTTPTLVITGAETWPGLRTAAAALADDMATGHHEEVPGGAHHAIPAAATADAVRSFLKS
jgi:alpha-beta hydrolase superfamily lysophospholipase